MRTESENEAIHALAVALLRRRGIAAEKATFDQYADAAEIAAEAVARGRTTEAEMLAGAAIGGDVTDETTTRVLSKFATSGKFVADLSVTEAEFLREAVRTEQEREETILAEARRHGARRRVDAEGYCTRCGYHVADSGCQCGSS